MENNQEEKVKELQNDEQKKKKKRKFLILFLLLFLLIGGTAGGVVVAMNAGSSSNTSQEEDLSTKFYVVIDPMIVTSVGPTHVHGAERFFLDDLIASGGVKNTNIEVNLEFGQYFCYEYSFTNNGKHQIGVTLNLNVEQVDNAYVTYAVGDGAEQNAVDSIYNNIIAPNEAQTIKVFIRITDINEDAAIKGKLTLTLTEFGE